MYMISHKHKFIFVHIPKCAGTSVEGVLRPHSSDVSGCQWAKQTKNLRNKGLFDLLEKHTDYFKFTICRNPYTRAVSIYRWIFEKTMTFNEFLKKTKKFLESGPELAYEQIANNDCHLRGTDPVKFDYTNKVKNIIGCPGGMEAYHTLPQMYFIENRSIDFVGRVESISEDFSTIVDEINILNKSVLFNHNFNHMIPEKYKQFYDNECRELVENIYGNDIEKLNYTYPFE